MDNNTQLPKSTFTNVNPTKIEKQLFRYAGFYKLQNDENCTLYQPVHIDTRSGFPPAIEITEDLIERNTYIRFEHMSETIACKGTFDKQIIDLIQGRMEELNWK